MSNGNPIISGTGMAVLVGVILFILGFIPGTGMSFLGRIGVIFVGGVVFLFGISGSRG